MTETPARARPRAGTSVFCAFMDRLSPAGPRYDHGFVAMCDDDAEARHNPLLRDLGCDVSHGESSDSDESDVDMEEQAHRERVSRWRYERERSAGAAREMHVLQAIRVARETRDAMDRSNHLLRLRLERDDSALWADDITAQQRERAAAGAADTLHSVYTSRDEWAAMDGDKHTHEMAMEKWRAHDAAWVVFAERTLFLKQNLKNKLSIDGDDAFEKQTDQTDDDRGIRFQDVPWPPFSWADAIKVVALLEKLENPNHSNATCRKRAFRKLTLRWHPDKFQAKHGFACSGDALGGNTQGMEPHTTEPNETHANAIARRVRCIAQELNDAWREGK